MGQVERLLPGVYGKVGAGVGVELDGVEFHSSRDAFERGRARDADLAAVGWLMVHFTAETASDIGNVLCAAGANPTTSAVATGVPASAVSPGQPVPGATGEANGRPVSGCGRRTDAMTTP